LLPLWFGRPQKGTCLDLSLITSLYRAEAHLPGYCQHVLETAAEAAAAGLALEIVIVANDATGAERSAIEALAAAAQAAGTVQITPLVVARETLYASWNRGVRAASGSGLGFWNVDDVRFPGALIEGAQRLAEGCALIYFPFQIITLRRWPGGLTTRRTEHYPARPFDREAFERASLTGPFFLFARSLYETVGPFDEHFRIAGDYEWLVRAGQITSFCAGSSLGGRFIQHGRNLSGSGDPRQDVEDNIIQMRLGAWERVHPARPDLMQQCWQDWGSQGRTAPPDVAERLWGAGADTRWQDWLRARRRARRRVQLSEAARRLPRFVIDHTGLRPALARLGIVKSAGSQ